MSDRGESRSLASRVAWRLRYWGEQWYERWFIERLYPLYARLRYPRRQRPRPDPASVRSVLIWNVDSIGDLTWTTPALAALRAGYPQATLTMAANAAARELLETNPHLDALIALKPDVFYRGAGFWARVPELEGKRFDVMVILEMGSRPADAARLLSRRLDVGYTVSTNLGLLKHVADYTAPPNAGPDAQQWAAYFLKLIEHLGLPAVEPALAIFATDQDRDHARTWLAEHGLTEAERPIVGFHPCVAAYANLTKKWPTEHFVELARLLNQRRPVRFVLTGSPGEKAECEALAVQIRDATGAPVHVAAGEFSPRQLVPLLAQFAVVVVADTAILHLAAAAGARTVGLFGATSAITIAPRAPHVVALSQNLPCSPCHSNRDRMPFWPTCIFARQECMYQLTPARVASAVEEQMPRPPA